MTTDDGIYGLPQDSGPMALFYNKTSSTSSASRCPTTWDEYIAAGKKIHAADPTKYITNDGGDAGFAHEHDLAGGGPARSRVDGTDVTVDLRRRGLEEVG